jgi:GT2 family glycosyltransferase
MSWTWSLPINFCPSLTLRTPVIDCARLRAIVPTFRDWDGARLTVEFLLACTPRPAEILLVNDNDEPGLPLWVRRCPIIVANYMGNRGPACARNWGARLKPRRPVDWLYFTDSGCARSPGFFAELVEASAGAPRTTVAIAAPVVGGADPDSPVNRYMTEEGILCPPRDLHGPQAIVTANAAVSMHAFQAVGGFDESYPFAAAEDLDLGVRLRRLGPIGWAERAVVTHRFEENLDDFRRRFVRYGAGNAHLAQTLRLPGIHVGAIRPSDPALQYLADLQGHAMRSGYAQMIETHERLRLRGKA